MIGGMKQAGLAGRVPREIKTISYNTPKKGDKQMSYESYNQLLCASGHYSNDYIYNFDDDIFENKCYCGADIVWWNGVDITNGSFDLDEDGNETSVRIDGYVALELLTEAQMCVCKCCNNQHEKTPTTYKLPEKGIGHHKE
jgi:hypothetical protein